MNQQTRAQLRASQRKAQEARDGAGRPMPRDGYVGEGSSGPEDHRPVRKQSSK